MQGLELCRKYFESCGMPVLKERFPDILPHLCAGLCGSGSECFGFDDEISRDHDFEPGFCIFLPSEDIVDRRTAFLLERAYAALPGEFEGIKRLRISPVGGSRHGVIRREDFFREKTGMENGTLSAESWLRLPQWSLAESVNGEIFYDGDGAFSSIREYLRKMPRDIMLKRLAGQLLIMAQSGQYNYCRCLSHKETAAAKLALTEFVKAALESAFLLSGVYMPYYKWSFRALDRLDDFSGIKPSLEYLLCAGDDDECSEVKQSLIEETASFFIDQLQKRQYTEAICGDLEKHAYSVNDRIEDGQIRNLHILYTVGL
ncbi:MAG: hypothetical protein CW338_08530 [Clostridiales bacterium]|nr:hypothetical protein [Clostridiales bacterium]